VFGSEGKYLRGAQKIKNLIKWANGKIIRMNHQNDSGWTSHGPGIWDLKGDGENDVQMLLCK
jgi:hypothetical protein